LGTKGSCRGRKMRWLEGPFRERNKAAAVPGRRVQGQGLIGDETCGHWRADWPSQGAAGAPEHGWGSEDAFWFRQKGRSQSDEGRYRRFDWGYVKTHPGRSTGITPRSALGIRTYSEHERAPDSAYSGLKPWLEDRSLKTGGATARLDERLFWMTRLTCVEFQWGEARAQFRLGGTNHLRSPCPKNPSPS